MLPLLTRALVPASPGLWLPQLDAVAFRVREPCESAIVVLLDLLHGHAVAAKFRQHPVQIRNAVIVHERRPRGAEIVRVLGKNRPDSAASLIRPVVVAPLEIGVAIVGAN